MRSEERAYFDEAGQRYLHARCMKPYAALAESRICQGARVLDAGCGAGSGSLLLAAAGAVVHAVDSSHADVVLTARSGAPVKAITADVCRLPYRDQRFDLVISSHVLEHLAEPGLYLSEIRRVLLPGGQLWLVTPNRLVSSPYGPPTNPFHVKEYLLEELAELVSPFFPRVEYRAVVHVSEGNVSKAEAKRDRWHSLDRLQLRRFAPPPVKRLLRVFTGALYPSELSQVDASDFRIDPMVPSRAVDLMAICRISS
jgi:2-polyprenyl-3-methyl-5-hydroxy-6-metoxy-1,4-benzoquinol methylase